MTTSAWRTVAVIALRKRIELVGEPSRERRTAEVDIRMKDGRALSATEGAYGDARQSDDPGGSGCKSL